MHYNSGDIARKMGFEAIHLAYIKPKKKAAARKDK